MGLFGPVTGVPDALELGVPKLAGWKRGNDGSRRCIAGPLVDDWRDWTWGRRRPEGMARGSVLGERGELTVGMFRAGDIVEVVL